MNRRGFMSGIMATLAAPAVIRTPGILMPVKKIIAAPTIFYVSPLGNDLNNGLSWKTAFRTFSKAEKLRFDQLYVSADHHERIPGLTLSRV